MKSFAERAKNVSPSLTLAITAKGNKMKADGVDVVSFGAGEPDFNTPQYIIDKAKEALDKGITKYTPASGTVELRKAIAEKFKKDNGLDYDYTQIIVSNGAKHSLDNVFTAILNVGDEVILPSPYWLTYPELIKLADGVPVVVDAKAENGFKITAQELEKAITPKTKAIVFNNPSNPTGAVYTEKEVKELAKVLEKHDIFVIADEIYEKLTYGVEPYSIAKYSDKLKENTIVVNGVSKTYSMTGWRIGYTASNKELASIMGNVQSHKTSNPNSMAQYATVAALKGEEGIEFLKEMQGTFATRRQLMINKLNNMKPLTFVEPDGAFYMMVGMGNLVGKTAFGKVINTADDFATLLVEKVNVVVIPCESFGAPEYIRLSYAISIANITKGLDRIKEFVDKNIK